MHKSVALAIPLSGEVGVLASPRLAATLHIVNMALYKASLSDRLPAMVGVKRAVRYVASALYRWECLPPLPAGFCLFLIL